MIEEGPFEPFETAASPLPVAEAPPVKRRAGRPKAATNGRAKRNGTAPVEATPEVPKQRKKRGPNKPRDPAAVTSRVNIDLHTILRAAVGMTAEDAHLCGQIATRLQTCNKKARDRIVSALGKVFA